MGWFNHPPRNDFPFLVCFLLRCTHLGGDGTEYRPTSPERSVWRLGGNWGCRSRNQKLSVAVTTPQMSKGKPVSQPNHLIWVVVSNIFYFHSYLGKIPILTDIFQLGWNHQLVIFHSVTSKKSNNTSHWYHHASPPKPNMGPKNDGNSKIGISYSIWCYFSGSTLGAHFLSKHHRSGKQLLWRQNSSSRNLVCTGKCLEGK